MGFSKKPTRYFSSKQEKRVCRNLGCKLQPNSGATKFAKGDLQDEFTLFECKTVTRKQKQFTIQKDWLTKLREETLSMGKVISALVFDFGDGDDFVVLSKQDFKNLYEGWKENNND